MKNLYTTTLSSKGQLVFPAWIRKRLGVKPGNRLYVWATPDGDGFQVAISAKRQVTV